MPWVDCTKCGGDGWYTVGYTSEKRTCFVCDGSGKFHQADDDDDKCGNCGGDGWKSRVFHPDVVCPTCGGTGKK